MLQTFKKIFAEKEVRNKILFTIYIILLFRIGSYICVPGMNKIMFNEYINSAGGLAETINLISGGAFSRFSIFAMTIGPYITASIVLNLLQMVIPSLEQLTKEGEDGKKTLAKYTKWLTLAFAVVEGLGLYLNYKSYLLTPLQPGSGAGAVLGFLLFMTSLTAGTSLLTWLADKITEKGIGNGISVIVFVSIISRIPEGVNILLQYAKGGITQILVVALIVVLIVAVLVSIIYIQEAERRIPVNYAKKVVGRRMYGGQNTHIPLKLAMAGVMPIIFAMSFMMFPSVIIKLINHNPTGFWLKVYNLFSVAQGSKWYYLLVYALIYMFLTVAFTFVYTMFMVNPVEIANQLKKNGGFIPGIRAGKNTSDYISQVLTNVTSVGAVYLALIAVFPIMLQAVFPIQITFGGTSILIIVSVAMEMLKSLETNMVSRHYKGFLD